MRLDLSELAVRRFKDRGSDLYGISSIAHQLAVATAEVAEVEAVAPSGGVSIHEEPGRSSSQMRLSRTMTKIGIFMVSRRQRKLRQVDYEVKCVLCWSDVHKRIVFC